MTLEQLRVLQAILTAGTFHGAAKALNKSQPALSTMIKKLEDEIGFSLLSRDAYRPALTPAGRAFYSKAQGVLTAFNALQDLARLLSDDHEREVHLVATATCDLPPLLADINQIRQAFPQTHIRLSIAAMGGPLEQLMEGRADLIIATTDGVPLDRVQAVPYAEVQIIPVCHAAYPPAQEASLTAAVQMLDYPQIVVSDGSSGAYEQSRDVIPGTPKWTVSDFAAKKQIIMSQMGWGGLPRHLIAEELRRGELVPLALSDFPIRHSQLMLMRRQDHSLGPASQALWQKISR